MNTAHDQKKILIVDDDAEYVQSSKDLLESAGYVVVWAHDGQSGLSMARRERPDLMILDVMMGHMTEGFEVSRKLQQLPELKDMPILMITGIRKDGKLTYDFAADPTWLPVTEVLEKPIPPRKLLDEIEKALRSE